MKLQLAGVLLVAMTATAAPAMACEVEAEPLPLNERGYAYFYTKSGNTYCGVDAEEVRCSAQFTNTPVQGSMHANAVRFNADGTVEYLIADADVRPELTLDYKTYSALGWTIDATTDGTWFTNDQTGHGMFVSVEKVEVY